MMFKLRFKAHFLFLALFVLATSLAAQTKPVKGTWVNLPYQDVRNKYMNPAHVDYMSPDFWEKKLIEQAEMGIEYIVIMAVANEQKSFYPSDFMELAYPAGAKSPVEAIMETADKHNMKVFMSCGWAIDQDDDLRKPEIREIQQRIMTETANKFKHHKSFFGWYLPVEDSFEPYLSDHAVDAVNTLTAKARSLTPGKQIMVSPYGFCNADMKNPKFAAQIKRLTVDIIAYQDEVGCVREPMPMKRMKEHFTILGQIHKETNIKFWANVESFTWEKGDNDRESALIPGAFARYLSQIVGVSKAGAEEVISFSTYGIYDKPASEMPIGQPYYSNKAYQDYMDWRNGFGRWSLLEATFKGDVNHIAVGKKVTSAPSVKDVKLLVDKKLGEETTADKEWVDFGAERMEVVIDLGNTTSINTLAARFMNFRKENISLPSLVHFYVSSNNKDFERVETVIVDKTINDLHDCWVDIALADDLKVIGRYIKIEADNRDGGRILCDEILVNPAK